MSQISNWQPSEGRDTILSSPLTLSWLWHLCLHLNQFKALKFLSILLNVPTDILACFQSKRGVGCWVSLLLFCWGFLSSAGVVNCMYLLSTWTSAGVSTREGVGDLHSWRAKGKAEKRILQKGRGKPSISRRAVCSFDSVFS